ncbi:DExH-box ATP-dependent RNA helicase [Phytophthora fragariae]|uniref:RNA helicase n=1 Tax=Phytophthora fragariae TaxID=53985 RepID=A0A6A3QE10_9STRA|nr:DExH-box ATP-dependent RNA helicase [Phytophthora fragariae]KAE9074349.1 DExH-box ATP-dependent RNA helicase [Phytophthora fragariae]KAE9092392.1 DExH-box ATP-dependent RNA helicase [Phytophthora fragariae]
MGRQRQPGHRQRGAGTVSVSKGESLRQGVLCKEWQRTPQQLLHEFCQAKKRRGAFYPRAKSRDDTKFRVRCVLPDAKDSSKDLSFCPEQEFDSQDEAKHCAALLALKHVEPLRPHERKLPDPYRDLWLALGSESSKNVGSGSGGSKNKKTKNEKEEKSEGKKEETDMDLWSADDTEDKQEKEKKEMPLTLTMDRKFASHKEFEAAKLARTQERNKKQRSRENRERANLPKQVMMSASCRELIEGILRKLGDTHKKSLEGREVQEESDDSERQMEEEKFQKQATQRLNAIGFTPAQIKGALQNYPRDTRAMDEDAGDARMTAIFDWLCLNIPEGDLPKKFNPEGTQLDVVLSSSSSEVAAPARTTVLVQRLMKFGYDRRDAVFVANEFVQETPILGDDELKAPSMTTLFTLLQKLFPLVKKKFGVEETDGAVEPPGDEEELLNQRLDEIFALEAIYDEKLKITTLDDGSNTQLLDFEVTDAIRLHVFLPSASRYPFELPLLALTSSEPKYQPHLLAACGEAHKSCVHSMGEPMLYDIYVAIDTYLQDKKRLSSTPARIQLLEVPAVVKAATTKPSPTLADKSTKPDKFKIRKKKGGRSANHHEPKRVDTESVRRMSEKLLQLRKAKDGQHNFQQMLAARAKLPAGKEEGQVIQCVQNNQVVLICGATGCGKTTQIPQFILDEYINRGAGGECNIICTQPRRIAAIGVATRVAQERCEDIAGVVGYQIRMDAKKSSSTRLLFCTTGVLLRRLLNDRQLSGVSHVIVDEVHERNVDTDFLLSILRDLLPQRPDLRVILMSATMNSELFVNYFSSITRSPCPVLDIPGFTYPVECNFLEEVLEQSNYEVPKYLLKDKKQKKKGGDGENEEDRQKSVANMTSEEIAARVDDSKIDYDLIFHLVRYLVLEKPRVSGTPHGAILVFLPGTAEIKRLVEMLTHGNGGLASKVWVLPLHGSLSGADQAMVFKSAPAGKTKVIVSTNIAETSITINDITAVIDSGKVKEMVYDNRARRSKLLDCWASRAASDQRKGRAGRVQAGTCYRLFSRKRFAAMDAQLSAEIHRVSLEQLCLQIKKLELGSIKGFLSKAIEPPNEDSIDAAIQELVDIAAFRTVGESPKQKLYGGSINIHDEEVVLTPLGNHLAMLPLDARIGKFLVYGSILRCIEPVAIIAACISSRSPFLMSMSDPEMRSKQDALKKELGGSWKSDHLLLWKLVERYAPLRGQKMKRGFCRDIGLSYDTMESILDLKQQYLQQLDNIGFYEPSSADNLNENSDTPRIIKAALCAGLYANVAQVVYPEQKYFQAAHGVVEEDHNAKQIRYFVRSTAEAGQRERVFLHPSSCNFSQTNYDSPWLLYTELVQTSKIFVRESTMVNPYALLLFGGQLEVIHEMNLLTLDGFISFNAVARIGVLIKTIRQHLDRLLMEKIADPFLDIAQSGLVTAISHLLKSEGM